MLARRPDVLVLSASRAETADWLARWRQRVPPAALSKGAVVVLNPDQVTRMGPRLLEGTLQLCERLEALRAVVR